jgi:subtilisin family serine protease
MISMLAGTALGTTYGVAKEASVYDIKVFTAGGYSTLSRIIAGFNHVAALKRANPSAKYVLNASFGGYTNTAVNQAVADLVAAGVVVVVSAGNDSSDACIKSPASEPTAITVGSTDRDDQKSWFSNYGSCVDLFAPGNAILSASNENDSASTTLMGTSMSSPHVAGIAALLLEVGLNPFTEITALATANVIPNPGPGSPNRLAYSIFSNPAPPTRTPTRAPTNAPASTPTPTSAPNPAPATLRPTRAPTHAPTSTPNPAPATLRPTRAPTPAPTPAPACNLLQQITKSVTSFFGRAEEPFDP